MRDELSLAIEEMERDKEIPRDFAIFVIKSVLEETYKKNFNADNCFIKIEMQKGIVKLFAKKIVVEEVKDPVFEITLKEAKKIEPKVEQIGEEILVPVNYKEFKGASIREGKNLMRKLIGKKMEENLYERYSKMIGEIVTGTVVNFKRDTAMIDISRGIAILPGEEQIPGEVLKFQKKIKAIILNIDKTLDKTRIILSRSSPLFLQKLFELEVPEIESGIVKIEKVVREAGIRAKIAVSSKDPKIDAAGSMIGPSGIRVRGVSREANFEHIDIIRYDTNPARFVQNSFSPGKVTRVEIEENKAKVYAKPEDFSLALGKNGINVRLASLLVEYEIELIEEESRIEEEKKEE